jgi:hypothetical protein
MKGSLSNREVVYRNINTRRYNDFSIFFPAPVTVI